MAVPAAPAEEFFVTYLRGRNARFFLAVAASLAVAVFALLFSPFKSQRYKIPSADEFVAWYYDDTIMPALVHGTASIATGIRNADVLLLGSSRMLEAISAQALDERFRASGIKFFNVGIAGGEGAAAHDAIIQGLDLRNKTLIVNLENNALAVSLVTPQLREARAMDWFNAVTRVALVRSRAIVETFLDHVGFPHLAFEDDSPHLGVRANRIGLRDVNTGDWRAASDDISFRTGTYSFVPDPDPKTQLKPDDLDQPKFKAIIDGWLARGMHLIFVVIPYGESYYPPIVLAAQKRFGGDTVALSWEGIMSADTIHVDWASRQVMTKRLGDGLAELPRFRPR